MDVQNSDAAMCSMCNVPMVNGTCPQCGMKAAGSAPAEAPAAAPATETPQA